jgi:tetratricopeptide (TPR) repeat protein
MKFHPMSFLGKAIEVPRHLGLYPAHILACALTMLACAPALHAQQSGQSIAGDCNVAVNDLKDVQIGNIIVTCIGEAALMHLAEAIANKRPDLLSADDKEKLKLLRSALRLTEGALEGFFRILGEEDIPPEKLAQRLTQIAEDYGKLREQIKTLDPDDPGLKVSRDQALAAIDAGRLDEAKDLLARIVQVRRSGVAVAQKLLLDMAEAEAALGRIAVLQRRDLDAAAQFRAASDVLPAAETTRRRDYRNAEADAFSRQGDERGDNQALGHAIALYRALLHEIPRKVVPLDWAAAQNNLGYALRVLGARESGTARLEEAAVVYRAALEEYTRERAPLGWAATQNNLGIALVTLGERESGTARLKQAVEAYRAALQERGRERVPLDWAATQHNLGNALRSLGARESGTARL